MSDFFAKMIMGDFERKPRNLEYPFFDVKKDDFENKENFIYWQGISDIAPRDLRTSFTDGITSHFFGGGSTITIGLRANKINNKLTVLLDYALKSKDWMFIHNGSIIILTDDKTSIKLSPTQLDSNVKSSTSKYNTNANIMEFGTCILKKSEIMKIASSKWVRIRVTGSNGLYIELTNDATKNWDSKSDDFELDQEKSDSIISAMKKTVYTFFDKNKYKNDLKEEIDNIKEYQKDPKAYQKKSTEEGKLPEPWYKNNWYLGLSIILFWPIGLYGIYRRIKGD